MQANPALPWTPADGGRIILEEPITEQEILAGALDFIVRGGTPEVDQHLQIVQGSGVYDLQLDGDTLWNIEKITGEQTELIVNSVLTGVEGYNLISIERVPIPEFISKVTLPSTGQIQIERSDGEQFNDNNIPQKIIISASQSGRPAEEAIVNVGSSIEWYANNLSVAQMLRDGTGLPDGVIQMINNNYLLSICNNE